jgi:SAM-dependent methyltransferase
MIKLKSKKRNCPICKSVNIDQAIYANDNYKYLDSNGLAYSAPLNYQLCKTCVHIYLSPVPDLTELYEKCIIEYGNNAVSARVEKHIKCFNNLFSSYFLKTEGLISLLEIGCGNGSLLKKIMNEHNDVISYAKGIEPSKELGKELINNQDFDFENIFFNELKLSKKFDLIILDNVFEHFEDPREELKKLKTTLSSEGNMYISIPNILKPISGFVDIFAGHPSNYLIENLKLLLNEEGFSIDKYSYDYDWLNCVVRHKNDEDKIPQFDFPKISQTTISIIKENIISNNSVRDEIKLLINKVVVDLKILDEKLYIFGAGDHSQELLSHIDFKDTIGGFIDSNTYYHGKQRLGFEVHNIENILSLPYKKILISSRSFQIDMKRILIKRGVDARDIICLYG